MQYILNSRRPTIFQGCDTMYMKPELDVSISTEWQKNKSVTSVPYVWYYVHTLKQNTTPAPSLILLYHTHHSSKIHKKGVFFEEIQYSHFLEKRGYFGTHLPEFGKGVNFESSVLPWKRDFIGAKKVSVLPQKRGFIFGLKSQCFITKRVSFWVKKLVFCRKKRRHFQTGEQGWVPLVPVSEGAGKQCSINLLYVYL